MLGQIIGILAEQSRPAHLVKLTHVISTGSIQRGNLFLNRADDLLHGPRIPPVLHLHVLRL